MQLCATVPTTIPVFQSRVHTNLAATTKTGTATTSTTITATAGGTTTAPAVSGTSTTASAAAIAAADLPKLRLATTATTKLFQQRISPHFHTKLTATLPIKLLSCSSAAATTDCHTPTKPATCSAPSRTTPGSTSYSIANQYLSKTAQD